MPRRPHPAKPSASIVMPSRLRRRWLTMVIAAVLAMLVVYGRCTTGPAPRNDRARYHDRSFRVSRVVDGDTLDIDAPDGDKSVTRIRLWGVDTPEVGHGRGADMHFGPEAQAFAERTLQGREVRIVLSQRRTRGKYGRLLAYVFLERGGRMFNEMLIEQGYGYADLRFKHDYGRRFEAIERDARKAGVGLWANITDTKMPAWKQRFESRRNKPGD